MLCKWFWLWWFYRYTLIWCLNLQQCFWIFDGFNFWKYNETYSAWVSALYPPTPRSSSLAANRSKSLLIFPPSLNGNESSWSTLDMAQFSLGLHRSPQMSSSLLFRSCIPLSICALFVRPWPSSLDTHLIEERLRLLRIISRANVAHCEMLFIVAALNFTG